MAPPWEELLKNLTLKNQRTEARPPQPHVSADGRPLSYQPHSLFDPHTASPLPQSSSYQPRSLFDPQLQPQFFTPCQVREVSTPPPQEEYYYIVMLPEEAKGVHETKWQESSELSLPPLPFTDIVMLVTSANPPSPSVHFYPTPEFYYMYIPPPNLFMNENDGICLPCALGENNGRRMTIEESTEYYAQLIRMGKYDELPVPKGLGKNIVYHVRPDAIERLDLSFGCKQALDIYNQLRNEQLRLVEVVKANCQCRPSRRVFYVTFCVKKDGGCDVEHAFQAELILVAGATSYIVWQIRRK